MNIIPKDVLEFLNERSTNAYSSHVLNELEKLDIGGYFTQYCRSIVYNSIGNIKEFENIRKIDDPRDVISLGDENDGMFHWYSMSLFEISEFEEQKILYISEHLEEEIPNEIFADSTEKSIGEIISELKMPDDEGFPIIELRRIFGRNYSELPISTLAIMRLPELILFS